MKISLEAVSIMLCQTQHCPLISSHVYRRSFKMSTIELFLISINGTPPSTSPFRNFYALGINTTTILPRNEVEKFSCRYRSLNIDHDKLFDKIVMVHKAIKDMALLRKDQSTENVSSAHSLNLCRHVSFVLFVPASNYFL